LAPPVGWVCNHPEITPPSNFHHRRDTTCGVGLLDEAHFGGLNAHAAQFSVLD
jgi:hypothetical protein